MLYPQQNPSRSLLDLSGIWEFQPDPQEIGEAQGYFRALPHPRPIAVPGSWNEQYADLYPYLAAGWYWRQVVIPAAWQGQRIFVRVGSANYRAVVWVNGKRVGEHEGASLPFHFEITPFVRWGEENTLAILVENHLRPDRVPPGGLRDVHPSASRGYPDAAFDFYPYTGIHRPVTLLALPQDYLEDITFITERQDEAARVRIRLRLNGSLKRGKIALSGAGTPLESEVRFTDGQAEVEWQVGAPRWWSPDDPFLYTLTVTAGQDCYALPVGLRTVEVDAKQLLLNGKPIQLRGFGRHEDFPASGRGLNLPLLIKDYDLLRWVGANSYRTSHYPYSEEEMCLADRMGLLIIDEIPAVGLLFEDEANIAKQKAVCLRMIEELIQRDKNHPAVILWSVANEPMLADPLARLTGKDSRPLPQFSLDFFRELIAHARALDPTRPITLAGMMGAPLEWQALTDVISVNRYWGWYEQGGQMDEALKTLDEELDLLYERLQKPILLSEFGAETVPGLHSQPPLMFSEEYQAQLIRGYVEVSQRKDFVIGAHVWNFADFQALQSTQRIGGLNHKGVFTRDRRPKLAAHVLRELWRAEQPAGESVGAALAAPKWSSPAPAPSPVVSPAKPVDDLRALLEDVARRLDSSKPGLTTTLKLDFGKDGIYRLIIRDGAVALTEGDGEANAWVQMQAETALKIFNRRMNPMAAVVTGKIKVGGDLKALSILRDF